MGLNKRLIGAGATASGALTPSENFKVVTYTGNGSARSITGVGFKPDMVWIKERSGTGWHMIQDSTRGVTKRLAPNSTNAESTDTNRITSFDSDGFTLGTDGDINENGETFVAWCWKANGGTTSSNTDGSVTSTVQANTAAGFSIIKYTGNGSAGATIGHNLGVIPDMFIVKMLTDAGNNWRVYHKGIDSTSPQNYNIALNSNSARFDRTEWNDTAPTSSVFSVSDHSSVNSNTKEYICYAFADTASFSKFGSYTGTGVTQSIETGFEPAFLLSKRTSSTSDWYIIDNKRNTTNPRNNFINANTSDAEYNPTYGVNFNSNGFTFISTDLNGTGQEWIYMAFAADPDTEAPTLASSFDIKTYVGTGNAQTVGGYNFDLSKGSLLWVKSRNAANNWNQYDTIRGPKNRLVSNLSQAQDNLGGLDGFTSDGFTLRGGYDISQAYNYISYAWKADDNEPTIEEVIDDVDAKAIYTLESNANDVTGNYNATASGITYSTGKFGNAATYSGTNASSGSKIYVSNNIYGSSTSTFTVSLWIKCTNTSGEIPIAGNGGTIGGTTGYAIYLNSGKLALTFRTDPNQNFYADTTSINDNAWHHVALTCNNGDFVLYLDNSVNASGTTSNFSGNPTPTYDTYFGNRWNRNESGVIAGQIDQIRIYDSPLTAASITNLYNETQAQNSTLDIGTQAIVSAESIVSANANAGFSVVKYTGTYPTHQKIPHGLSAAPNMIMIKNLADSADWEVYHSATGNTGNLVLNDTAAFASNSGFMANTSPTATVFTVGNDGYVNGAGDGHIAYCFHDVAGYSKFGSYTSNASTKITTGFQPDFFIFKYIGGGDWYIQDATQTEGAVGSHGGNLIKKYYVPNTTAVEDSVSTGGVEIMSDGFYPTNWFDTTNGVIYAAFKKNVPSNTTLANSFKAITYTGTGSSQSITGTGFKPDLVWIKQRSGTQDQMWYDNNRGAGHYLSSNNANAQGYANTTLTSFDADGFSVGSSNSENQSGQTFVAWCWKAGNTWQSNIEGSIPSITNTNTANGFSIVKYTGTGANTTVGHNLGAAPEVMIIKDLDNTRDWAVYHIGNTGSSGNANEERLKLNLDVATTTYAPYWNGTTPTSTVFSLGNEGNVNTSGQNYIAYCWTPKSGYSKFGSYTGSGSNNNAISLGFQPDFVMVKRTNSTGGWLMFDSVRSGSNPINDRIEANNNQAEQTNSGDKWLNFNSTNFEANGSDSELNQSGGTYIYMAFKMN